MFTAAIVEDEKRAADLLASYLERYGSENEITFNIVQYSDKPI